MLAVIITLTAKLGGQRAASKQEHGICYASRVPTPTHPDPEDHYINRYSHVLSFFETRPLWYRSALSKVCLLWGAFGSNVCVSVNFKGIIRRRSMMRHFITSSSCPLPQESPAHEDADEAMGSGENAGDDDEVSDSEGEDCGEPQVSTLGKKVRSAPSSSARSSRSTGAPPSTASASRSSTTLSWHGNSASSCGDGDVSGADDDNAKPDDDAAAAGKKNQKGLSALDRLLATAGELEAVAHSKHSAMKQFQRKVRTRDHKSLCSRIVTLARKLGNHRSDDGSESQRAAKKSDELFRLYQVLECREEFFQMARDDPEALMKCPIDADKASVIATLNEQIINNMLTTADYTLCGNHMWHQVFAMARFRPGAKDKSLSANMFGLVVSEPVALDQFVSETQRKAMSILAESLIKEITPDQFGRVTDDLVRFAGLDTSNFSNVWKDLESPTQQVSADSGYSKQATFDLLALSVMTKFLKSCEKGAAPLDRATKLQGASLLRYEASLSMHIRSYTRVQGGVIFHVYCLCDSWRLEDLVYFNELRRHRWAV